ncbi:MAG: antitoxin Xre/MbcA/ParS toxin-binding domain-containing protein [Terracidiphilus sp.]|jgi:putative toxin-antitoxin system antitoxin component (TIGR02293 family)
MVNELTAVFGELGGEKAFGRSVLTGEEMNAAIREGFRHSVVEALMGNSGLTLKEISTSLDLSPRSLQRRKHEGRLARYESDRLYRLARMLALADYFIGSRAKALDWMKRPNIVLGGAVPLHLIDTELGARLVENTLGRIAYGGVS